MRRRRRGAALACAFVAALSSLADGAWAAARGTVQIVSNAGGAVGDGLPALQARLSLPRGVAVDPGGVVYIADTGHHVVRAVAPNGIINRFAGTGVPCPASTDTCGDGNFATIAKLREPWGVTYDPVANAILIADTGDHRVRAVSSSGVVVTLAGTGEPTTDDKTNLRNGEAATSATLRSPTGVSTLADGSLLIADRDNDQIRIVRDGLIDTAAGGGLPPRPSPPLEPASGPGTHDEGPPVADGLPAQFAKLDRPSGVATIDGASFLIADTAAGRVRQVDGTSRLVSSRLGIGDDATTTLELQTPLAAVADADGNLYISDSGNNRILHVNRLGVMTKVAGGSLCGFSGDNGPAALASLCEPSGLAVTNDALYIADSGNNRIRRVDLTTGTITTFAGGGAGDGGAATNASLTKPTGLAVSASGTLYIADAGDHRVRRVSATGTITTFAGDGVRGFSGDGFGADEARLDTPTAVAVSGATVYIADTGNDAVRSVSGSQVISSVGFGGLTLSAPQGVAVDGAGALFVADTGNGRIIRRTSAGSASVVATGLSLPTGLSMAGGLVHVAETGRHRVVAVDPNTSAMTVVAGDGTACTVSTGACGDGGPPASAQLSSPRGVAVDTTGEIYVADTGNNRVRYVSGGTISTVQGTGAPGFAGDHGAPLFALLNAPHDVAIAGDATSLFIADTGNRRVRKAS